MTYEEFNKGLQDRGFINIEEYGGIGRCRTVDSKHYILVSDGVVIYSNIWDYTKKKTFKFSIVRQWDFEKFNFIELDELIERGNAS